MKTKILVFLTTIIFGTMASAQTVDEIVTKWVKANGGAEKLRAVKSMVSENTIALQGIELENKTTVVVNKQIRSETKMMGSELVQAFDGNKAWGIIPVLMGGTNEPLELPAEAAKTIQSQLDPFPLLDYAAKKTKLEYLGTESLNGQTAWHLKLITKDSATTDVWIDANSGFLRKMKNIQDGQPNEIVFSKEREQDGIFFSTHMDITNAAAGSISMETKTIALNSTIDPAIFQFPAKK
jgi:hypothetical protein